MEGVWRPQPFLCMGLDMVCPCRGSMPGSLDVTSTGWLASYFEYGPLNFSWHLLPFAQVLVTSIVFLFIRVLAICMICINRYFMGDIKLASVDGFGTDTYIYLQVSSYFLPPYLKLFPHTFIWMLKMKCLLTLSYTFQCFKQIHAIPYVQNV